MRRIRDDRLRALLHLHDARRYLKHNLELTRHQERLLDKNAPIDVFGEVLYALIAEREYAKALKMEK